MNTRRSNLRLFAVLSLLLMACGDDGDGAGLFAPAAAGGGMFDGSAEVTAARAGAEPGARGRGGASGSGGIAGSSGAAGAAAGWGGAAGTGWAGSGGATGGSGGGGPYVCIADPASAPSGGSCVSTSLVGYSCNPVTNGGCDVSQGQACDYYNNQFQCLGGSNVTPACAACDNTNGPFCMPAFTCANGRNQCTRYCCNDSDCGAGTWCVKQPPTTVGISRRPRQPCSAASSEESAARQGQVARAGALAAPRVPATTAPAPWVDRSTRRAIRASRSCAACRPRAARPGGT